MSTSIQPLYNGVVPVTPDQPFMAIEIQGKMSSLTPSELLSCFQVNFITNSFISEAYSQRVMPELEKARLYYEKSLPESPKRGRTLNQQRLLHVPSTGIESIPDYLYLKPININNIPQLGVFASCLLKKGTWIGTYAGELFPGDYPSRSLHAMNLRDRYAKTHLQVNSKHWGNHTRFCNHSYHPNAIIKLLYYQGMYHVILNATRRIKPHEQIVYDYGKKYWQTLGIEPEQL